MGVTKLEGTQRARRRLRMVEGGESGQPQDAFPAVAVTAQAAPAIERTRTGYELVGLMWPPVQPSAALLVAERDHGA